MKYINKISFRLCLKFYILKLAWFVACRFATCRFATFACWFATFACWFATFACWFATFACWFATFACWFATCLVYLCFIFTVSNAGAGSKCVRAFESPAHRQFIETLRHYSQKEHKSLTHKKFMAEVEALSTTSHSTRKEILGALMRKGYIKVQQGPTPLFDYILYHDPKEVSALIKSQASLLYKGTLLNLPPFFLIVFVGDKLSLTTALSIDPKLLSQTNELQQTPLHVAIDPVMAKMLLERGANPNATDKQGHVPLHNSRNLDTVRVLLDSGADPQIKDRSGVPLKTYHQKFVGDPEIIQLLEESALANRKRRVFKTKKPRPFSLSPRKPKTQVRSKPSIPPSGEIDLSKISRDDSKRRYWDRP